MWLIRQKRCCRLSKNTPKSCEITLREATVFPFDVCRLGFVSREEATILKESEAEALYVIQRLGFVDEQIASIFTKEIIEAQYQLSYN